MSVAVSAARFFQRAYPSANSVLLPGERPVLVDSGFGSDVARLRDWLGDVVPGGVVPALLVNTHHHSDHVGGNHVLQTEWGLDIAAHAWEGGLVNRRDPEACAARFLNQPVQAYRVTRLLHDGDVIETGGSAWQVIHTPGHSLGHISLFQPEEGVLVSGDALLPGDVGWLNPYREGVNALNRMLDSLERLSGLRVKVAFPSHGPAITDVPGAIAAARERLLKWQTDPQKVAWHGCKRIFAFALMIDGPKNAAEVEAYLLESPWFREHALNAFKLTPVDFVPVLLREMERSGAARWQDGKLTITAPHHPPPPHWAHSPTTVTDWN